MRTWEFTAREYTFKVTAPTVEQAWDIFVQLLDKQLKNKQEK